MGEKELSPAKGERCEGEKKEDNPMEGPGMANSIKITTSRNFYLEAQRREVSPKLGCH